MSEERYLLMKRGLYYAPDRQGYTGVKARAGRYREVDALGLDGVTAIHEDEAEDFSPACWEDTKIAVLTDRIEALEAEVERLRGLIKAAGDHWITLQHDHPIDWEDAIDAAMGAACDEIRRLSAALGEK